MNWNKERMIFLLAVMCFMIASLMIWFVPIADSQMQGAVSEQTEVVGQVNEMGAFAYIIAVIFWFATISGYILFFIGTKRWKALGQQGNTGEKKWKIAANFPGLLANLIFIASLIGFLITQCVIKQVMFLGYLFIFLLVLSFHLQIILNSASFTAAMNLPQRQLFRKKR